MNFKLINTIFLGFVLTVQINATAKTTPHYVKETLSLIKICKWDEMKVLNAEKLCPSSNKKMCSGTISCYLGQKKKKDLKDEYRKRGESLNFEDIIQVQFEDVLCKSTGPLSCDSAISCVSNDLNFTDYLEVDIGKVKNLDDTRIKKRIISPKRGVRSVR